MRRICIWSVIAFLVTWMACKPIFRTSGHHGWSNAQGELSRMHGYVQTHKETYSDLPDATLVNRWVSSLWSGEAREINASYGSCEEDLASSLEIVNYDRLKLWGSPPKYIISKSLPDGFGFYMEGEDSVSRTNGDDPDDINSWNPDSRLFYYHRLNRNKNLIHFSISIGAALIAAIACKVKWIA